MLSQHFIRSKKKKIEAPNRVRNWCFRQRRGKTSPLIGINLEQNPTRCRQLLAVTAWNGEGGQVRWGERQRRGGEKEVGEKKDKEDRENIEHMLQDPGRTIERVVDYGITSKPNIIYQ